MEDIQFTGRGDRNDDALLPKLIKTLVPSPVIKDIFEANLRGPDSQDVIFIKVSLFYNLLFTPRIMGLNCIVSQQVRSCLNRPSHLIAQFAQQYRTFDLARFLKISQLA